MGSGRRACFGQRARDVSTPRGRGANMLFKNQKDAHRSQGSDNGWAWRGGREEMRLEMLLPAAAPCRPSSSSRGVRLNLKDLVVRPWPLRSGEGMQGLSVLFL